MKRFTGKGVLFLLLTLLMVTGGCAAQQTPAESSPPAGESSPADEVSGSETPPVNTDETALSYLTKYEDRITAGSSSVTSPLSMEEWGSAAKYCTMDHHYVNVPVRVLSVRQGEAVTQEAEDLSRSKGFSLPERKDGEEFAIAEYEISLDGFPVDQGGTLCDITAFVTGTDGAPVKNEDGSYFSTTALCPDTEHYYYEGVIHSLLVFKIRRDMKEYLLTLGEYDETQAFVKITSSGDL